MCYDKAATVTSSPLVTSILTPNNSNNNGNTLLIILYTLQFMCLTLYR